MQWKRNGKCSEACGTMFQYILLLNVFNGKLHE